MRDTPLAGIRRYRPQLTCPRGHTGMPVRMDAPSRIPAVASSGQSEAGAAGPRHVKKPATRLRLRRRAIRSRNAQPPRGRRGPAREPPSRPPRRPVGQPSEPGRPAGQRPGRSAGQRAARPEGRARRPRRRRVIGLRTRLQRPARPRPRPQQRQPLTAGRLARFGHRRRGGQGPGPWLPAPSRPATADVPAWPVRRLEPRSCRAGPPWRSGRARTGGNNRLAGLAGRPAGRLRPTARLRLLRPGRRWLLHARGQRPGRGCHVHADLAGGRRRPRHGHLDQPVL
jgi:hypothetical protein